MAQLGSSSRLAVPPVMAVVGPGVLRAVEHPRQFVEDPTIVVIVGAELLCDHTPSPVLHPYCMGLLPEFVHLLLLAQLFERDVDQ